MEYVKCGDYYIPNLELGFTPRPIGRWGRLRRDYLRQFRPITYHTELLSGVLWEGFIPARTMHYAYECEITSEKALPAEESLPGEYYGFAREDMAQERSCARSPGRVSSLKLRSSMIFLTVSCSHAQISTPL